MHGIAYRSNSFGVIKAIICLSIIIQLSASIYVAIDFSKVFNLFEIKTFNIKLHDIRFGTIISIIVFDILQIFGLFGALKEVLYVNIGFAFLTALQAILWFILVFYSTVFLASFLFTTVLTVLSVIYCYKIPRDGIGNSGQTESLMRNSPSVIVTQMFGSEHQLQELYQNNNTNSKHDYINKVGYPNPNPNPNQNLDHVSDTYVKF
jgi:hypothetical protein